MTIPRGSSVAAGAVLTVRAQQPQTRRHRRVIRSRARWPDYVWAFHQREEIGPNIPARIATHTVPLLVGATADFVLVQFGSVPRLRLSSRQATLQVRHGGVPVALDRRPAPTSS